MLVYRLNSKTPAVEQLQRFLAFDVMITPHGSHMTNMVFSNRDAVVVEVRAAHLRVRAQTHTYEYARARTHTHMHTHTLAVTHAHT